MIFLASISTWFLLLIHYDGLSVLNNTVEPDVHLYETHKIIRGPYLQSVTPTGIIIRWRTDLPTDSRLVYGTSLDNLNGLIENKKGTTEHVIQLSDLEPDTKYFYRAGNSAQLFSDADSTHYFITSPANFNNKKIRIWATGDFGTGDSLARSVKNAYLKYKGNQHTDVWLMLGDIAYTRGTDKQYQEALFDNMYDELLPNTVAWPTPGNHDCRSADSESNHGPYYDIFSLPVQGDAGGVPSGTEAYYSFNYGTVHFISLDTEDTPMESDSKMIHWLQKDLEANKLKWTIVFFHHPPYTHGTHNSDMHWDSGGRMFKIRENILPLLDTYGVDLVLSGHSHVYERSYLIANHYGQTKSFRGKSMVKNTNGKKRKHPTSYMKTEGSPGAVYVVCGVSGSRPSAGKFEHPAMAFSTDRFRGSVSIEIEDNRLNAVFLDNQGVVRDWFRIEKKKKPVSEIPDLSEKN